MVLAQVRCPCTTATRAQNKRPICPPSLSLSSCCSPPRSHPRYCNADHAAKELVRWQAPWPLKNESKRALACAACTCLANRDDTRKDEAVLSHLRAENDYSQKKTAHLDPLRAVLSVLLRTAGPPNVDSSGRCVRRARGALSRPHLLTG